MAKDQPALKQNVFVDGTWYGPNHPHNELTADVREKITNPAAFEAAPIGNPSHALSTAPVGPVALPDEVVERISEAEQSARDVAAADAKAAAGEQSGRSRSSKSEE